MFEKELRRSLNDGVSILENESASAGRPDKLVAVLKDSRVRIFLTLTRTVSSVSRPKGAENISHPIRQAGF